MRESLLSIPISEVFEPKCGCPLCAMHDTLEGRCVEYIMGAAMMEPDVREETNKLGFCSEHYGMLLGQRNRLSLALMLETRLAEVKRQAFAKGGLFAGPNAAAKGKKVSELTSTCFVCSKIDWAMERMLDTLFSLYAKESAFRQLFSEQAYICLPHYRLLCSVAAQKLSKKEQEGFLKAATALAENYLAVLSGDVSHYCKMYDYRNAGPDADWGNSKDSIERAILFLTSHDYRK